MRKISAIAIVILGIACATLATRNVVLESQVHELEMYRDYSKKVDDYRLATDDVLNEVSSYIENKYGECLDDTIWEGDVYEHYLDTFFELEF